MLRQIMINKKIEQARTSLKSYTDAQAELEKRAEELEGAIGEAKSEEEVSTVEEQVKKLEEEKQELEEKKSKLEEDIKTLETELEELSNKEPENKARNKGDDKMEKRDIKEGLSTYVRSKGTATSERAGFTSVEGGALIPEELLAPQKVLEDEIDLTKFVNVKTVNSGAGKYPIIKKSGSKMTSVAELAQNPELAKPTISDVTYDIETYRGFIPVSQEVIDDADYDVAGMISEEIENQALNTKNEQIATILKTATPKAVTGIDGLKEVFNKDIKKIYAPKAILSASLFNELDTTKDGNGRYLLQDDITVASGKKLFGYEVIVLDDEVIGTTTGDLVGFVGDAKRFVTLFDRKKASVKWVDNDVYGQLLAGYVRFDVKSVDNEAGFYVTYTAAPIV